MRPPNGGGSNTCLTRAPIGIRSGQDVMRALALGAKSCMIGRAYAYGLGAGGQAGVAKAIDIIKNELNVTMGLCGINTIAEIDDNVLAV